MGRSVIQKIPTKSPGRPGLRQQSAEDQTTFRDVWNHTEGILLFVTESSKIAKVPRVFIEADNTAAFWCIGEERAQPWFIPSLLVMVRKTCARLLFALGGGGGGIGPRVMASTASFSALGCTIMERPF